MFNSSFFGSILMINKFCLLGSNIRWEDSDEASEMANEDQALVPSVPLGVSGTALAASLLRDGWSVSHLFARLCDVHVPGQLYVYF